MRRVVASLDRPLPGRPAPSQFIVAAVVGIVTMAICPHCEGDLSDWARRLERAPAASSPKVWTCPECDVVLGISDYEN